MGSIKTVHLWTVTVEYNVNEKQVPEWIASTPYRVIAESAEEAIELVKRVAPGSPRIIGLERQTVSLVLP